MGFLKTQRQSSSTDNLLVRFLDNDQLFTLLFSFLQVRSTIDNEENLPGKYFNCVTRYNNGHSLLTLI